MKKLLLIVCLLYNTLCLALPESCNIAGYTTQKNAHNIILGIQGRVQWLGNDGYCGEVSLISAGLYYGQYLSQYDARVLANRNFYSKDLQLVQILIGYFGRKDVSNNIVSAAEHMHFNYQQFNNSHPEHQTSREFLLWIKRHLITLHPIIIGVYENSSIFGQKHPDPAYDHIVPVFGFHSEHLLNEIPIRYYPEDKILIHDNYLYTGEGYSPKSCYQYFLGPWQKTRQQANSQEGTIYSLSDNQNHLGNFGLAITGVKARGVTLLPVRLYTKPVSESPAIKDHSNIRPKAEQISLTIQISKLQPNTDYILYKYINFKDLPIDDDFSKLKGNPSKKCIIRIASGHQFTMHEVIDSNTMAIYRAMRWDGGESLEVCK